MNLDKEILTNAEKWNNSKVAIRYLQNYKFSPYINNELKLFTGSV
ncbi:5761_t:CDS:1, partial [Acaulospora morrowiae]